jgi:hypothetical protein
MHGAIEAAAVHDQQIALAQQQQQQQQPLDEVLRTRVRLELEHLITQRCGSCARVFGLALGANECACLYCPAPCSANICAACSETFGRDEFADPSVREIEAHEHVRKHCVYAASVELAATYDLRPNQLEVARARRSVDLARQYRNRLLTDYGPILGGAVAAVFDEVAPVVMADAYAKARSVAGNVWIGEQQWLARSSADVCVAEWLVA